MIINNNFNTNIFINCPFDDDYVVLLRPLLFTILYLGMNPCIASERSDSGETRITKICDLIGNAKYGIHDISRIKSDKPNEYFRQNMPFELGVDFGARMFGSGQLKQKKHLILEKDPHDYHAAFSDISGMDIKNHNNKPDNIICAVRNWFYETVGKKDAEEFILIWYWYSDFQAQLERDLEDKGLNQKEALRTLINMPVVEFMDHARDWIINKAKGDDGSH